jgi:hypothetical protein
MSILITTPGASNANSYPTLAEADTYFVARLFSDTWNDADESDKEAALVMATRLIDTLLTPHRYFVPPNFGGQAGFFRTRPYWTGAAASSTQALAWPRTGMYNRNGFAILSTVIPTELKQATAEFSIQLMRQDRTTDNEALVQGITSVKTGSVELKYGSSSASSSTSTLKLVPDAAVDLLVPSWMTNELIEPMFVAAFDVVSS